MKAVQTMAATAPGPRHKPRRTGRAAELLWPPKARDVEHGLLRGVRLLPGLNRLLSFWVMAALVTVVHRSFYHFIRSMNDSVCPSVFSPALLH